MNENGIDSNHSSAGPEDFEWDASNETVTAWSKSAGATVAPARPRRAFGTFGTRRRGRQGGFRTKKPPLSREVASEDSTYLMGDETPEKSLFSRDNAVAEHTQADFPSGGGMERLNPPRLTRSATITGNFPSVPKPMRRSMSLALGSTPPNRESSKASAMEDFRLRSWSENAPPNRYEDLLEAEIASTESSRKKLRARRSSIHGSTTPLADMVSSNSFSHLARSADLGTPTWLKPDKSSTPPKGLDFGAFSDVGPSPARSVASSRKRCVNGSPISDMDDWSSGNLSISMNSSSSLSRRSRSRSRIYSPTPGMALPFAPPLNTAGRGRSSGRSSEDERRNAMDVDSDGNASDSESNVGDTPDTSFESVNHHRTNFPLPLGLKPVKSDGSGKVEVQQESVLQTMSSYEDLKFLIKTLRKEKKGRSTIGMGSNSWSVAPPATWVATRRSAFFQWTTRHLGFDIRATGGSFNYLQISQTRGLEVLSELEDAFVAYKKRQAGEQKMNEPMPSLVPVQDTFSFMDTSCSARKPSPEHRLSAQEALPCHVHTLFQNEDDFGAGDLVQGMETLELNQSGRNSDASLVRHVTLEPAVGNHGSSRPSFDGHVPSSQDLMLHLNGDSSSDDESPRKGKMSLDSVHTAGSYIRSRGSSAPFTNTLAPIQSFDLLETPLASQDEGWGSCPVQGRDWGESCKCDDGVLSVLFAAFDSAGRLAGVRDSFGAAVESGGRMPRRSSILAFELESNVIEEQETPLDDTLQSMQDNEESDKQLRRRKVSYAKHKRMSLWASATQGGTPILPKQKPLFRTAKSLAPVDEDVLQSADRHEDFPFDEPFPVALDEQFVEDVVSEVFESDTVISTVFSFLNESELLGKTSLVCTGWSNAATNAHAQLMLASVGYTEPTDDADDELDEPELIESAEEPMQSIALSMERSWQYLNSLYPWGCFLSEGAFKQVYKVHNSRVGGYEALSVMDVDMITDKQTIAAELVVSSLLSSLARRAICPNFILTHGVFTCPYEPAASRWGSGANKRPKGGSFVKGKAGRCPKEPSTAHPGRYQYIRMELCTEGDAEEFLKRQPNQMLGADPSRMFLFQIAFALHAAADKFSMKHYDMKLLNIFVQDSEALTGNVVLRYGLGSHMFALKMPAKNAVIAKLADYGTANVKAESNGQPATIAQFTTLENTPPDYMILGDQATQGHGHDTFGLGLCMLHLFTGNAPYEEILEDVKCPAGLKTKLRRIWEDENVAGYDVIRAVVLSDVYKDEAGNIIEGEPDETLYDTLYRFLVLFGIPTVKFQQKECPKVWQAISEALESSSRSIRKKQGSNAAQYHRDCKKFSVRTGNNKYIARARKQLESMEGGLDLLFHLCSFDPAKRASAMDVLNSYFMQDLQEQFGGATYDKDDTVYSYTAFSTHL